VTLDRALTLSLLVVSVVVGGLLAMVGAFFVPTRYGVLSLGDAAALLTVGPYARAVGRAARSTAVGAAAALAWLLTTFYFAATRPEGDLVVTGSGYGIAYLLLGTVSGAVGIGTIRSAVLRDDERAAERAALADASPNGSSPDASGR
jgi:hypothetical protein